MTAVADGGAHGVEVGHGLILAHAADATGYRKLFDGSRGEPLMSAGEIMEVAVRMRDLQQHGVSGPLAVVIPGEKYPQFARMLGILSIPKRPIRFFSNVAEARAWLEEPDVRDWRGGEEANAKPTPKQ